MIDQFDSFKFAEDIKAKTSQLEQGLPIGYQLSYITFQPNEIEIAVSGVMNNLYQTIGIVLVVVMVFLGWRTGLLVGAMVPLVMLLSILVMRIMGIELERMSLATLIIALGLLVDNGIVIAEDISRRLAEGEDRLKAVIASGQDMSMPLLSSSLTTVFAFMPLMLADSTAGEYTRSISLVIAISLLGSWVMAVTAMPLFCYWFLKPGKLIDGNHYETQPFYRIYRSILDGILSFRFAFLGVVLLTLFGGVSLFAYVPKVFFPASERTQLQILVDAPVGSNSYLTLAAVKPLQNWLLDKAKNPEVKNHVAYVAGGGPRFYLGLDPNDSDPFRAFLVVNVKEPSDILPLLEKVRQFANLSMPDVRVTPKPMSMGPGEAGLVEYRIVGSDAKTLKSLSERIMAGIRAIPGSRNIKDDWENPTVKIIVDIDQARARRAGVTSEQVANALNASLAGSTVSGYREGDQTIPVILREKGLARKNIDRLRTLNIGVENGNPIPLLQIATFRGQPEFSLMQRRDLERTITISAVNKNMTAAELDTALTPLLSKIQTELQPGYEIEKGGELESSAKAQGSLFAYMPLAFALIILVLVAQFDSFKRPLIILLTIPLVITGISVTLFIAPNANFSFMAILGLLALAGIVINNAIVLIDRIEKEREDGADVRDAILNASVTRLKPILMTTATTVLGLLPIIIARDVLFYDLALVISGGMIAGTVLTLGVVPVLYSLFFRQAKQG
jgi:multidrug efflux pump subunit AcrB